LASKSASRNRKFESTPLQRRVRCPHTLDDNDTRLARGLGWGQAEDFFVSLRDNFDALHREGEQTPKIMTVALHCRLVDHILRHDRVWICRRNEIAEHWWGQHPARDSDSRP
jgi:hypothetical protein